MNNLSTIIKRDYIQEANWETLYLLTENRKKNLEFIFFDIKFLENLVENHFSVLLVCQNLDELRELQIEVFELKKQCKYLLKCVQTNLDNIVDKMTNHTKHHYTEFRIENKHIECTIQVFITKKH